MQSSPTGIRDLGRGGFTMIRRGILAGVCALGLWSGLATAATAQEQAYGRQWARSYNSQDWDRFYHYPYLWYPQNFWSARLLPQLRESVLPISARDASAGLQQALAQ